MTSDTAILLNMRVLPAVRPPRVLRTSRRRRTLRTAPRARYWPTIGDFRPVHVDGRLCWLWVPKAPPEPRGMHDQYLFRERSECVVGGANTRDVSRAVP